MYTSGDSYIQSINVNMLPGYMQLADIPSLYVSQYDMGLYKYKLNLYEKNSPYDIDHWFNPEIPETDDTVVGSGDIEEPEPSDDTSDPTEPTGDNTPSEEGNDDSSEDEKTYAVYIQGIKPDGKIFRYECEYEGNSVMLPEKEQITNIAGRVKCEIILIKDELRKTSSIFYIEVEASLIQDAYKVSQDDVEKFCNEKEAEPSEDPEVTPDNGDDNDNGDNEGNDVNDGVDPSVTTGP